MVVCIKLNEFVESGGIKIKTLKITYFTFTYSIIRGLAFHISPKPVLGQVLKKVATDSQIKL